MGYRVLDTNVISYLMKSHPFAEGYLPHLKGHVLAVSFVTVAELYEGALRARWGRKRRETLEAALGRYVVVPSSLELCRRWAVVRYGRRREPIAVDDAWIAATALVHDCPLLTHNPADFRGITGLRVVSTLR